MRLGKTGEEGAGADRGAERLPLVVATLMIALVFALAMSAVNTMPASAQDDGGGFSPSELGGDTSGETTSSEETTSGNEGGGAFPEPEPIQEAPDEELDTGPEETSQEDAAQEETFPEETTGAAPYTCSAFANQQEAQAALDAGEPGSGSLDADGDGEACEDYFGAGLAPTGGEGPLANIALFGGLIAAAAAGATLILVRRSSEGDAAESALRSRNGDGES